MEGITVPLKWEQWPEAGTKIFKLFRSEVGEELILDKNIFVERILFAAELQGIKFKDETSQYVSVLHMDSESKIEAYRIYKRLLHNGIDVSFDFSSKAFKTQLKHAISNKHTFAIIVGKDEIDSNTVQIKHLLTQTQEVVSMNDILTYLKKQKGLL